MSYPIIEKLLPLGEDTNRPGAPITVKKIVSHRTANPTASALQNINWFASGYRGASAHYFVDKTGIYRCIPENEMAWHAGSKTWPDGNPNTFSIGIELTDWEWAAGYAAYVDLHADICHRYGLDPLKDIIGHFQIDPVNRPADPIGLFQWQPFLQDVKTELDNITKALGSPTTGDSKAGNTNTLPNGLTPIVGQAVASSGQMRSLLHQRNANAPDVVDLFLEIGKRYNIRGDIAFAQGCKETGFWKFGGDVKPEQHNPAGIGATGGVPGNSFPSWAEGIEAQIQHLYAYATDKPLPDGVTLYDPRFHLVKRGSAPYVEWLGAADNPQKAGWAYPGKGYGYSIINDYMARILEQKEPADDRLALLLAENAKLKEIISRIKGAVADAGD